MAVLQKELQALRAEMGTAADEKAELETKLSGVQIEAKQAGTKNKQYESQL